MQVAGKRALVIINPKAGRLKTKGQLFDIAHIMSCEGYVPTVYTTTARKDATEYTRKFAPDYDLVVCRGGDGTFNEVVNGMMSHNPEDRRPIGYIPSGTTNDLAKTLSIPTNSKKAVSLILNNQPIKNDVGLFNNDFFAYVASFGTCTKASYGTPQTIKNVFGHAAYLLEGLKDLKNARPIKTKMICDDEEIVADITYGSVSNSMSLAKVISLDPKTVKLNDGKFEVLLAKMPVTASDWKNTIDCLLNRHYDERYVIFRQASQIHFEFETETAWTVDGEYGGSQKEVTITNLHKAIEIFR